MEKIFPDVVYTNCSGCIDGIENQISHELCLTPIEEKVETLLYSIHRKI